MIKSILISFRLAFQNIRANFFHTLLSILGIVIGVAALVTILSMIDGMEKYAHQQISKTTSLESVNIQANHYATVDGIRIKKDSIASISYSDFQNLRSDLSGLAEGYIMKNYTKRILTPDGKSHGVNVTATAENLGPMELKFMEGRAFTQKEVESRELLIVINLNLKKRLATEERHPILGDTLLLDDRKYSIIGIIDNDDDIPRAAIPITTIDLGLLKRDPPTYIFKANTIQLVGEVKDQIVNWIDSKYGVEKDDFSVVTNEFRVQQTNQGFLLFRIIMGLIVGISVLVGGIGVMNVLLISVTERTSEIGVRKATGAKRKDILLQFLCESITVSAFGSFLGIVLGILATFVIVPIVNMVTEVRFEAAYTLNTLLIITIIALAIGVMFGTYPALKASKLDPVEAMRHE